MKHGILLIFVRLLEYFRHRIFEPHLSNDIDTPGGCEAAAHSARRYIEALIEFVKLDFPNAFNSLHAQA